MKKLASLLPPKRPAKRDSGVNVRFTQDEYDELERIATYRDISVTELVYHVIAQFALPQLRDEMEAELADSKTTLSEHIDPVQPSATAQSTDTSSRQPELLTAPTISKNPQANLIRSGNKPLPGISNTTSGESQT